MNILWIHGWGQNPKIWERLKEHFPDHTHSHPTFKDISHPSEFVLEIKRKICSPPNVLIGWSLGGMLAIEAAIGNPHLVHRIVGINTTLQFTRTNSTLGWPLKVLRRMQRNLKLDPKRTLKTFFWTMFKGSELSEIEIQSLWRSFFNDTPLDTCDFSLKALESGLDYLIEKDLTPGLPTLDKPVLFIHGERDAICPIGGFKQFNQRFGNNKNLTFKSLPNSGHLPFLDFPDEIARFIKEFLNEFPL